MPTALNKDGFRFYFYSNEHEPMHIHVEHGSGEAVFNIADDVALVRSVGMKVQELGEAERLANENLETLREKWHDYFE